MLTATTHGVNGALPDHIEPASCTSFGYFFPDGKIPPVDTKTAHHFEVLRDAMVEIPGQIGNSPLPPIFTYFGQFIDHDITNQFDSEPAVTDILGADLSPSDRDAVTEAVRNQRTGKLDLDSLYGPDGKTDNRALDRLISLMRFPPDPAKMRLAFPDTTTAPGADFPKDKAADLLRLHQVLDKDITIEELASLPKDHLRAFLPGGDPNLSRALIGDSRNDENLIIAQLHVAFLRLHNRIVDAIRHEKPGVSDKDVFVLARQSLRWLYQWLVVNVYLPGLCDPVAVREVLASGAALYGDFRASCGAGDHAMPMPLEFSVAAFRFGHSMVRDDYDWNRVFGRSPESPDARAPFNQLFAFTGNGRPPMFGVSDALPANWVADFDRLVHPLSQFADRSTRRIDTRVAKSLTRMSNEEDTATPSGNDIRRDLVLRNLRRGVRMSIPSAQACQAELVERYGFDIPLLTPDQLASGPTGQAIRDAGFDVATPLWFYVLKEAEVLQRGQRLGPLGTHLVAGTLAGLVLHDPDSYWHREGSAEGRWHPVDGPRPGGQIVDSLPAFFRAAGLMEV